MRTKSICSVDNEAVLKTLIKLKDDELKYSNAIRVTQEVKEAAKTLSPKLVGSVVEWLERRNCDGYGLGSKLTCAIMLCPWERLFTALSPAWWSWQAVLNFSHISIKFQVNSNILASPEAGGGNYLPYVLAPPSLSCESGE